MRVSVGATAPDAVVRASGGEPVRLSELWCDGTIVLTFLRHFRCAFCLTFVSHLRDEHNRIVHAGASVAAVTVTSPLEAAAFRAERAIPFECLADADGSASKAFAIGHAGPVARLARPAVVRELARSVRAGVAVRRPPTGQSPRRLPATFVVARGGAVRLAHYGRHAADLPHVPKVLAALGVG